MLLQEWCATVERRLPFRTNPVSSSQTTSDSLHFFPDYNVHLQSTECAILYHKELCVTTLDIQQDNNTHSKTLQMCGIILHSGSKDYGIYSVYRTGTADACDIFKYNFECDHIIIGGDFNIHHPLWGSTNSSSKSTQFVEFLNNSKFKLLNKQTPTRIDPHNNTLTNIDLSLSTFDIPKISWQINQHNHDPKYLITSKS